jgi:hypothetical protein
MATAPTLGGSGSQSTPMNTGKSQSGGVQTAPGGPASPVSAQLAAAMYPHGLPQRGPQGPFQRLSSVPRQPPPNQTRLPAPVPMMGPTPHPGVNPPYPDARSGAVTLMPNGVPVMPMPPGFPLANAMPRVPLSFVPGMVPPASSEAARKMFRLGGKTKA